MSTPRTSNPAQILALGAVLLAFAGTIGVALVRSNRTAPRDVGKDTGDDQGVASPPRPLPVGQFKVMQMTSGEGPATINVSGIGRVNSPFAMPKASLYAWLKVPPATLITSVEAWATFGSFPPTRVQIDECDSPGIACVSIPPNYPPGIDRCTLTLKQGSIDLGSADLEGLVPTERGFALHSAPQGTTRCGPASISAQVWRLSPDKSTHEQVSVKFTATMPPKPNEHWEISTPVEIQPEYRAAGAKANFNESRFGFTSAGQCYSLGTSQILLANIQDRTELSGALHRFEVADEVVTFRQIPTLNSLMHGVQTSLAVPRAPMTATTPSGVKVTLIPWEGGLRNGGLGDQSTIAFRYTTDPPENRSVNLSASPAAKIHKGPVTLQIDGDQRPLLQKDGPFANPISQTSGLAPTSAKNRVMTAVLADPAPQRGILPELRLVVHHRVDLQSFPYRLIVPILREAPTKQP